VATDRKGIADLTDAIARHGEHQRKSGALDLRRAAARRAQVRRLVEEDLHAALLGHPRTRAWMEKELDGKRAPHSIAAELSQRIRAGFDAGALPHSTKP
jgi:putative protein kinase ArgK-like GTPase of G3E family